MKATYKPRKNPIQRAASAVRNHLIPHEDNRHVPHLLHHRALFSYSVIMVLLKTAVITASVALPSTYLLSSAITPENIIQLTNQTRAALGLNELRVDDKLTNAARAKAEDMFAKGYFAHQSPDGLTPWHWFQAFDYTYRSAGENLAAHFTEAEDVQAGWMASPKHRENIVSERFEEIGVGVVQGLFEEYQTTFVVQLFGYEIGDDHSPLPAAPAVIDTPVEETEPSVSLAFSEAPLEEPKDATEIPVSQADAPTPVEEADEALEVDLSKLVITPLNQAYLVEVPLTHASEAVLNLAGERVPLTPMSDNLTWSAVITYDSRLIGENGERLSLVAGGWNGDQQTHDLALVMPDGLTSQVYAFADKPPVAPKLLGVVDIARLDGSVQTVYFITIISLAVLLMIAVLIRMEAKRPTMVAHTLAVIGLALILTFV